VRARRPTRRRIDAPVVVTVALTLATIVVTAVWSAIDRVSQAWDPGRHLLLAATANEDFRQGKWFEPFKAVHVPDYPPLVHYVGGLTMRLIGHVGVDGPVMAMNLVFVPILATGAFLAGRTVAGRWGGATAAAVALGAPITVSLSHVFLLDMPVTAMCALSVGLLMASRRFALTRYAMAAGLVMGLGFLTKQTLPFYVGPFAIAILVRGGWRNPAGVAWAVGLPAVFAVPWYLQHRHAQSALIAHSGGAGSGGSNLLSKALWQAWSMFSVQLLAPFTLAAVVGAVICIVRARRGGPVPFGLELVLGLVGSLLVSGHFLLRDVRYSTPLLVLYATLAACCVGSLPIRARAPAAAGFVCVAVLNALLVNLGTGKVQLTVGAHADDNVQHRFTLVSGEGYVVNKPFDGGDLVGVLRRARRRGVEHIGVEPAAEAYPQFSLDGVTVASLMSGVGLAPGNDPAQLHPGDALIVRRAPGEMQTRPCATEPDGAGLYLLRIPNHTPFCP
jgi:hypothetical protein